MSNHKKPDLRLPQPNETAHDYNPDGLFCIPNARITSPETRALLDDAGGMLMVTRQPGNVGGLRVDIMFQTSPEYDAAVISMPWRMAGEMAQALMEQATFSAEQESLFLRSLPPISTQRH